MVIGHDLKDAQRVALDVRAKWILALCCLCAGIAPIAARWIPDGLARGAYSVLIIAILLGVTLLARQREALRPFWELAFGFLIFAVVLALNFSLPPLVTTYLLHEGPTGGNPDASTIVGTVVVQLLETAIAIVPVVWLTLAAGRPLSSIYARVGKLWPWILLAVLSLGFWYLGTATGRTARFIPTNGHVGFAHLLALTPVLLVLVVSNGFQEEFLFRGLFLQKYQTFFRFGVANLLQALIFACAHVGVTYTAGAVLYIVVFIFPIGLICGYLMRKTNGVVVPALFHAGFDIPIFLAFLSYVS